MTTTLSVALVAIVVAAVVAAIIWRRRHSGLTITIYDSSWRPIHRVKPETITSWQTTRRVTGESEMQLTIKNDRKLEQIIWDGKVGK